MTATVKENMKATGEDRLPDSELLAQMKCVPIILSMHSGQFSRLYL